MVNSSNLLGYDQEIFSEINKELQRQQDYVQMIASENTTWEEVLIAQGSVLTNKYAEGYPGKRYYGGCENVDNIELIAIERAKELFDCEYANVQPHSGSSANLAVYSAFLKPNDTILGMSLDCGGHLTHGGKMSISGKFFNSVQYGINSDDYLVNYDAILDLAKKHRPKLIIAGFSAYPRLLDWQKFRQIADSIDAILICDIAHISGLVAAKVIPSPLPFADVVTSTTHKTLRGPRSGLILAKDTKYAKKINSAVFPGIQGGPLMHVIAAKALAFKKASTPEFVSYTKQVIKNAKVFSETLVENGIEVVTGGTDCHLLLVSLASMPLTGVQVRDILERAGIVCNQNSIPFDTKSSLQTSGLRFGSPAGTSRGFGENEFRLLGEYIANIIHTSAKDANSSALEKLIKEVRSSTLQMCRNFPIYTDIKY